MISWLLSDVTHSSGVSHPGQLAWWVRDMFGAGDSASAAGVRVNAETSMNFAAVWRAVNLIAGTIATLPVKLYRRVSDEVREEVSDHRTTGIVGGFVNDELDSIAFFETTQAWALLHGNGPALIRREGAVPVGLDPLKPWQMQPDRLREGRLVFRYVDDDGREHIYDRADLLLVSGLSFDGVWGRGVVQQARESIGLGLGRQKQSANFVANGARPSGLLGIKSNASREQREEFEKAWAAKYGGPENAGKMPLVWGEVTYNQLGMTLVDAEWLAQQKFSVVEIGRWLDVPPHLLYELDRATWDNAELLGIEFLQYSLRRWLRKWARALDMALLLESERREGLYFEHVTQALLQTDLKSRLEAYASGRNSGLYTINDIRRRENMNPAGPEGDVLVVQSNMVPASDMLLSPEERNPKPAPGPEKAHARLLAATRETLLRAVRGLLTKEALAAKAAAKKPATFLAWLEEFYERHRGLVLETLRHPADAAYASLGIEAEFSADDAERHCRRSKADLLAAAECQPEQLLEAVERVAVAWETERLEQLRAELEVSDGTDSRTA